MASSDGGSVGLEVTIQNDWPDSFALKDNMKESDFWVSATFQNENQKVQAKSYFMTQLTESEIKISEKPGEKLFDAGLLQDKIKLIEHRPSAQQIEFEVSGIDFESTPKAFRSTFVSPFQRFSTLHKSKICSLGLSPKESLVISGGENGELLVWEAASGAIVRELNGHKGDIFCCGFFPSGEVMLSGSGDLKVKIWSLATGNCAATLSGHVGGVLDLAIIERGRNLISVGRDGRAVLWDVSTQQIIKTFQEEETSAFYSCQLLPTNQYSSGEATPKEVGTSGKVLVTCGKSGNATFFDLISGKQILSLSSSAPITSCCSYDQNSICVGNEAGEIIQFDTRFLNSNEKGEEKLWKNDSKGRAPVTAMKNRGKEIWVGRSRGVVEQWCPGQAVNVSPLQLTGPCYDPVSSIVVTQGGVVTGCRDRVVRVYKLGSELSRNKT